jgi:hypothetical protein
MPNQQLQGMLQKSHSVEAFNYVTDKQKNKDNSHWASLWNSTVE